MQIILITGGVRSGKSAFAEKLAEEIGGNSVIYVATGKAWDQEMQHRIDLHQQRRPIEWRTYEEEINLEQLPRILPSTRLVLLDTISGWITNLLFTYREDEWSQAQTRNAIVERIQNFMTELLQENKEHETTWIIVSDEVGLGGVAPTPLGRAFQDIVGTVNQLIAKHATEAYFVVSGIPMKLKGGALT